VVPLEYRRVLEERALRASPPADPRTPGVHVVAGQEVALHG